MPARRNTPRRARSTSVASNASDHSTTNNGTSSTPSRAAKAAAAASSRAAKAVAAAVVDKSTPIERPQLPTRTNPLLPDEDPLVKLQVIRREGNHIIIGRVKLPTTNGQDHAFLLKRFDTDAIAASSMFRLAYPWADVEEERTEMAYLEKRFDCERANGGVIDPTKQSAATGGSAMVASSKKRGRKSKAASAGAEEEEGEDTPKNEAGTLPEGSTGVKLQGTWLPSADAYEIAADYGLLRYVQPLIEARAKARSDGSGAVLVDATGEALDNVSASTRKRARKSATGEDSPSVTRTRVSRVSHPDGRTETRVDSTETSVSAMSPAQIEAQVAEAKALAQRVQGGSASTSRSGRKRRATDERPDADGNDVEVDDANVNAVVRTLRHTARAARRRPVVTSASALTAASAVGAGVLAWASGGNVDTAIQIVQNGLAQFSGFF